MAAAMMLSLTACGGGSSTETTAAATTAAAGTETAAPAGDQEKVVKIAYTSDPGSLGTFDEGSSSGRWTVLAYTYENLIYMGGDGEYYGILAKTGQRTKRNLLRQTRYGISNFTIILKIQRETILPQTM